MATIEYSLFRAKFIKPKQTSFFPNDMNSCDFFLAAVKEKPSAELRAGFHWHIGNLKFFTATAGYFAIGKTTKSKFEKFDDNSGDFVEEELEESPYTHCVFDAEIGIVGIAKKPNLAQTPKEIAKRLQELLTLAEIIKLNRITTEMLAIPDPDEFLKSINAAFKVYRFSATFHCPNPFDADEYFQKPLSVYLSAASGIEGTTTIKGNDLNREVLTEVTRSSAATGNEASARIQRSEEEKAITINLRGNIIKRRYDENEHVPETALADLIFQYHQVRGSEVL